MGRGEGEGERDSGKERETQSSDSIARREKIKVGRVLVSDPHMSGSLTPREEEKGEEESEKEGKIEEDEKKEENEEGLGQVRKSSSHLRIFSKEQRKERGKEKEKEKEVRVQENEEKDPEEGSDFRKEREGEKGEEDEETEEKMVEEREMEKEEKAEKEENEEKKEYEENEEYEKNEEKEKKENRERYEEKCNRRLKKFSDVQLQELLSVARRNREKRDKERRGKGFLTPPHLTKGRQDSERERERERVEKERVRETIPQKERRVLERNFSAEERTEVKIEKEADDLEDIYSSSSSDPPSLFLPLSFVDCLRKVLGNLVVLRAILFDGIVSDGFVSHLYYVCCKCQLLEVAIKGFFIFLSSSDFDYFY